MTTATCRGRGWVPPTQATPGVFLRKWLYTPGNQILTLSGLLSPTAAAPIWLCVPSSPTSALSGDAFPHVCIIEKTEIARHKGSHFSPFSTCHPTHSSLLVSSLTWSHNPLATPSLPASDPCSSLEGR